MNIQTHAHTHSVHTPAHAHTPEQTHAHTLGHTLAHPLVRVGETGASVTDRPNGEVSPISEYDASALPLGLILRGQAGQGNRTGFTGQARQAVGRQGIRHSADIVRLYGQAGAGRQTDIGQAFRLAQAGLIAGTIALPDRWCYQSLNG